MVGVIANTVLILVGFGKAVGFFTRLENRLTKLESHYLVGK